MFEIDCDLKKLATIKNKVENESSALWKQREKQFQNFNEIVYNYMRHEKPIMEENFINDIDVFGMCLSMDYSFVWNNLLICGDSRILRYVSIIEIVLEKRHLDHFGNFHFKKVNRCTDYKELYHANKNENNTWSIHRFSPSIDYQSIFILAKENLKRSYEEKIYKIDTQNSFNTLLEFK